MRRQQNAANHPGNVLPEPGRETVLLLGNYRPALTIARALKAKGHTIILGLQGEPHGVQYSQCVAEVWDHPELIEKSTFSADLTRFLDERRDVGFVLPVTEEFVNFFATAKMKFPNSVILVSPDSATVRLFSDKVESLCFARSLGVSMLPFGIVSSQSELLAESRNIGFPLTIRPLGTTARLMDKKALIVSSFDDLSAQLREWPKGHKRLLLQRFANGDRHNVYFAARRGQVLAVSQSKISRTNHPEGTGLAVEGKTVPVLAELFDDTEKLIAASNYTGIGLAQFILDPDTDDSCFLELNPRVSGSHAVPEAAGIPLSSLAVELAAGQVNANGSDQGCQVGKTGIHYAWTSGDIDGLKMAIIRKQVGFREILVWLKKAAVNWCRADAHMLWSWRDPIPALVSLLAILPKFSGLRRSLNSLFHPAQIVPGQK